MSEELVILPDDERAASIQTVTGWVSRTGGYWGDNERMARWEGSTHRISESGIVIPKNGYCHVSHDKRMNEKYEGFPVEKWDGTFPICIWNSDTFFFDHDEIHDFISDRTRDELVNIQFVACQPLKMPQVDDDYFLEELHEDAELPPAVKDALDELNKQIREAEPFSFTAKEIALTGIIDDELIDDVHGAM